MLTDKNCLTGPRRTSTTRCYGAPPRTATSWFPEVANEEARCRNLENGKRKEQVCHYNYEQLSHTTIKAFVTLGGYWLQRVVIVVMCIALKKCRMNCFALTSSNKYATTTISNSLKSLCYFRWLQLVVIVVMSLALKKS